MNKFRAKKSFGQNFLINNTITDKIISSVRVYPEDLIIEIGPGRGTLTKALKSYNAYLLCYEIDKTLKNMLDKLVDDKTKIIYGDFLKADVLRDIKGINYNNIYVIANIPYYITTPIIEKIISLNVEEIVLMVQNEVADRICAKPKSKAYGSLTVFLNYYYEIEKLFKVTRENFKPMPNVDSAVISLKKRKKKYKVCNEEVFFELIKDAFKFKRKNIKNNLYNYELALIEEILLENNLSLASRAEEISIEVFISIANVLENN